MKQQPGVWRLSWRMSQHKPKPLWIGTALFVVFFCFPVLTGLAIASAFDSLEAGDTQRVVLASLVLVATEAGRMTAIYFGVVWFIRAWVMMQGLLQANMLHAQVVSGGPDAGRPTASAGEAISQFRDDPEDVADFVDSWLDVSGGLAFTIISIVLLGAVDWTATFIIFGPMLVIAFLTKMLDERVKRYRQMDREATIAFTGQLGDVLSAATTIRLNDATKPVISHLHGLAERRRYTGVRDRVLEESINTTSAGFADIALAMVLLVSANALRTGAMTASELALFVVLLGYIGFLPRMIGRMIARRKQSGVAFANMRKLVADEDPAKTTEPRYLPLEERHPVPERLEPIERHPLERFDLRDLRAVFPDGTVAVAHADLSIERGSFTVITGPVGAGKTTLLRAMLGLAHRAEVTGSAQWNGVEIEDRAAFLTPPHSALLPQVPNLISDSLSDNVLLGSDPGLLDWALDLSAVADDISDMPDGVDTLVGPRGLRLSGGQRQRVAAARALVRQPELLVLDDLSSALDVETERRLWKNMADAGITVLAVSHRKVAFDVADQVLEMRNGVLGVRQPV